MKGSVGHVERDGAVVGSVNTAVFVVEGYTGRRYESVDAGKRPMLTLAVLITEATLLDPWGDKDVEVWVLLLPPPLLLWLEPLLSCVPRTAPRTTAIMTRMAPGTPHFTHGDMPRLAGFSP